MAKTIRDYPDDPRKFSFNEMVQESASVGRWDEDKSGEQVLHTGFRKNADGSYSPIADRMTATD